MALSSLDPLGRAGGVLPSADPSALEVAMDRNKQEDELAKGIQAIKAQEKAAAADNKQKEREAADKRKTALADGTLWFAHTLEGQKAYSNLVNSRAKRYQDYEAGIGTDPDMEGTDAYIADQIELQAWNQMNANSEQLRLDHAKVKEQIMKNRDLYTADALEKTDEEYANPEYLKNGELPNTLVALIDLNKAIESQFGLIEAEVKAWANPASDGGIVSGTRTQVLPESLKAQAEGMAAMDPNLSAKLGETMGNYTPEKQKAIKALAAANGISETAAVALDLATAKYGAVQWEAGRSQASEGAAGRKDMEEGLNWLAEWRKGAEEGKYEGNDMSSLFGISPASGEKLPDAYKTLKGWVFDQTEVYDKDADKNIKKETVIDAISLDRGKDKWVIKLDTGEIREIPTEKFESEIVPRLGAYNKEKITGIGGYLNSAKKSGYFQDIKGTGTKEMVKTDNQKPATTQPKAKSKAELLRETQL